MTGIHLRSTPDRLALALAAVAMLAAMTGCTSLPDARRIADASAQLGSAVAASGAMAADELDAAGLPERARELRKAWQVPERSTAALAAYAEALAAITQSGREGAESVRRVADAGTALASGVGIALPVSAAAATGLDIAATVYRQLASVRAASALVDALERMQAGVERTVEVVTLQLDDAAVLLVSANRIAEVKLRAEYADETGYLLALRRERVALYAQSPLTQANADRLLQIDRIERTVVSRLTPMNATLRASEGRLREMLAVTGRTRQALADWALAHRQLLHGMRAGTAVDPQALVQSVSELRDLVHRVRAR